MCKGWGGGVECGEYWKVTNAIFYRRNTSIMYFDELYQNMHYLFMTKLLI